MSTFCARRKGLAAVQEQGGRGLESVIKFHWSVEKSLHRHSDGRNAHDGMRSSFQREGNPAVCDDQDEPGERYAK